MLNPNASMNMSMAMKNEMRRARRVGVYQFTLSLHRPVASS